MYMMSEGMQLSNQPQSYNVTDLNIIVADLKCVKYLYIATIKAL